MRQDRQVLPHPTHAAPAPERWTLSAHDAASAVLLIPADLQRERRFEIACAITVSVPESAGSATSRPTMQMTVAANGAQQWQRKLPAHNAGAWDGLDYRFSRSVPVGQALRVQVAVACQGGARRRGLTIEADEVEALDRAAITSSSSRSTE